MKKFRVDQLDLTLYSKTLECTLNDTFNFKQFPEVDSLAFGQLELLLKNIVLNVLILDGLFYLISPDPFFIFLSQHPQAKKLYVNTIIHKPKDDNETLEIIDTLILVKPSLMFLFNTPLSTIHARSCQFKKMKYKATSLTQLALFANKSKSAFRK
ncbi:hypothetical protein [Psychromonas arctica]|uniref:hypothetical protein n=1 Tax=Psychromonas arctica TaxID=168275 RepID=UPI000405328A|nr:hypothetical protein [Psychromonas arctica]